MGLSDIKKELNKLDKEKLIDLFADLYKKNKSVKEFLDFYANPNENELFNKYKEKVYGAFYPKRGYKLKLADGKKAISDFAKLETSKELHTELMLYYVETGIKFTKEFGNIDDPFYNSLSSVYMNALTLMKKENMLSKFAERSKKIVDSCTSVRWDFYFNLQNIYGSFYK